MGRPPQFNEQQVLKNAMNVFWRHGYTGTSLSGLRAATGLNPGSIYNHFGSKKELFLQALGFYINAVVGERITTVLNRGEPLEGIESFFTTAFEPVPLQDLIGCLLTNTALDREIEDGQINAVVRDGIGRIEQAIAARLDQAQAAGDISPDIDSRDAAIHLVSCFQGLSVIGRLTKDKQRLAVITEQAMRMLRR